MAKEAGEVDLWYRRAREEGYRARSSFKLLQVDALSDVLKDAYRVVDLCAAPGSWSQVLARRIRRNRQEATAGRAAGGNAASASASASASEHETEGVVAVDLQEMAPIEGVKVLRGDITAPPTAQAIVEHFGGAPADVVVSDGAPDVTGLHHMDELLQAELLLAALNIAARLLRPGGSFVAKIFKGQQYDALEAQLGLLFRRVDCYKPEASRPSSAEHFVVARDFCPPAGYRPPPLTGATPEEAREEARRAAADGVAESALAAAARPYMQTGSLAGVPAAGAGGAAAPGPYGRLVAATLDDLALPE